MGVGEWTVPGYVHVRELGRNGGGRTVLAAHSATGLRVAIRYLGEDRDFRESARQVVAVESPNIAGLYEYVESHDGAATVREYVDGASLRKVLPGIGVAAALSTLKAGLLALVAAHARGVTHRGYKPENILVDAAGSAKLADFAVVEVGSTPAEDVTAAFATFVECVTRSQPGKLPRKLQRLAERTADGDALSAE